MVSHGGALRAGPLVAVLLAQCLGATGAAGQAVPAGPSFFIGSGPETVTDADVAVDPGGNFVVTFHEWLASHRVASVFDRQGTHLTGFVAPASGFVAPRADVAALGTGDFVVVWLPYPDDPGQYVVWQRWGIDGSPLTGEVVANAITEPHWTDNPVARGRPQGDFLVVWDSTASLGPDHDGTSIQGRRFDPAGPSLTGQFQLNNTAAGDQERPAVAVQGDGGFLVVWESDSSPGADSDGTAIVGRRYGSNGSPLGGDFQINGYGTSDQRRPSLAVLPGGGWVVTWDSGFSADGDDDGTSIQMRWLDGDGRPIGSDQQVNVRVEANQYSPDVAITSEGYVEILWSGPDAQRRTYGLDGEPLGVQETVSDNPDGALAPDLSTGPRGGFVVTWVNGYPDSVYARRYVSQIFTDGFESGDTSAWSTTVP